MGGTFKRGEIEECYWYRWGMENNRARNSVMVKGKQDQGGLPQWTTCNKDF